MRRVKYTVWLCLLVLLPWVAGAEMLRTSQIYNARIRSMGGAFTGVADDEMALIYNPAGLAYTRNSNVQDIMYGRFTLMDFNMMLSTAFLGTLSDFAVHYELFANFLGGGDVLPKSDYDDVAALIQKVYNLNLFNFSMDMNLFAYQKRGFAFGVFNSAEFILYTEPSGGIIPGVQGHIHSDSVIPIGVGFPLGAGSDVSLGLTLKLIKRYDINFKNAASFLEMASAAPEYKSYDGVRPLSDPYAYFVRSFYGYKVESNRAEAVRIGSGLGVDVGMMLKPDYASKVGVVVQDILNAMTWSDGVGRVISPNIRLGFGYKIPLYVDGFLDRPQLAFDIEDILRPTDFTMKLHFGMELRLMNDLIIVRGGINRGAYTASLGIEGNPFRMLFYHNKFLTPERPFCLPLLFNSLPNRYYRQPDLPNWNPARQEFWLNNVVFWSFSRIIMPIVTWAHPRAEIAVIGNELGDYAGENTDYQLAFMFTIKYYY